MPSVIMGRDISLFLFIFPLDFVDMEPVPKWFL